jgi:D-3-phosphoglycerate dehydrogenase
MAFKRILANDGIDKLGKALLEEAGFHVETNKVAQDQLASSINSGNFDVLLVRSATLVRKDIIDNCPNLKLIGRAGVGMDNIDVEYARSKGIKVINTPAASSNSVAELVVGSMFTMARMLYDSNKQMHTTGATQFDALKKKYAKGSEVCGKTIGIVGIGRIGQAVARMAAGLNMRIVAHDPFIKNVSVEVTVAGVQNVKVDIETVSLEEVLIQSDFITLHVPGGKLIGKSEFEIMKKGVCLVNCARGGVIDELELIEALNSGKVAHAALDVFDNEPTPRQEILSHPKSSLTPHIGAATEEAQERIGIELANSIIDNYERS